MDEPPPTDASPPNPVPLPSGVAPVAPYSGHAEHLAGLLHAVTARIGAALEERWSQGLLAEVGPPILDTRPQLELMLARASVEPGNAEARRAEAVRRANVVDARVAVTKSRGGALPLADAFDAWGLDATDRAILGCLLGADVSPTIARLLAFLGGDATGVVRRPSVEAVAAVLGGGEGGVLELTARLAPEAALRRLALVTPAGPPELPLLRRALVAAPRLVALARGSLDLDEDLRGDGIELQREREPALAIRYVDPGVFSRLRGALVRTSGVPVTRVTARRGVGALAIVCDAALSVGRPALRIRGGAIRTDPAWLDAVAREVLLHHAAVIIDHDGRPITPLIYRLARVPAPVVVVCDPVESPPGLEALPVVDLELSAPDGHARAEMWAEALGPDHRGPDLDLTTLAASARVGASVIERAASSARAVAAAQGRAWVSRDEVMDGLRAQLPGLARVARREVISAGWDALVLPGDLLDQVFELVYAARERRIYAEADGGVGRGAAIALLSGPRGTGKTLVAGLLARDLGLDLLELDVPSLIPGDPTVERALDTAFVGADLGLALLAFDRGARMPASLLHRLHRCRGVAVVMTTDDTEVDPAVRRAVGAVVALPFPAQHERERLWATTFPDDGRFGDALPFDALSREFKLTGAQIRLIAMRASALAAAADGPVSVDTVRALARRMVEGNPDAR